jgi:lysophospholipid acyltransferase (LPLAT)-like uncharacterized protein
MRPPPVRSSKIVIPEKPRWPQRLAALLIYLFIQGLSMTIRYRWTDRSGLKDGKMKTNAAYCIWHNRLALCMVVYHRHIRKYTNNAGLAVMVSASRDGGMLSDVLRRFGVQPARGSSSRRGAQALRELTTWARRGYDLAVTPDGPRGPRYVLQDGIIYLAQLSGLPIVPVTYNLSWKIQIKSWDQFQIPLPFSRCEMILEKPVIVPREASVEEREYIRAQIEKTLNDNSRD